MTTEDATPIPNTDENAATAVQQPATGIHTDPVDSFKCSECGAQVEAKGLPSFSDSVCPGCGTHAPVPARLSNFLLLKLMGMGGMGGVYYARDEQLGRFVAIKVMLQSLGDDPAFIETFRREAQAVAKLNHPNIAQIYSFGQEKGQPYIVMELVSGERVDAMMETGGGIPPALTMRIGLEIAQGLSAADEAGLVHGDIKPENILLDTKGNAKLVDFGLATVAHQAAGEGIWGTPYYIAPEKIRRQKVDARSDIYSLGATLYHMLTGKPPFEGRTPVEVVKIRLEVPPPDPCKIKPKLPEIISTTITRMLAVERNERYPNYLSLISDLRKAVQELGTAHVNTGTFTSGKQIRFKHRKKGLTTGDGAGAAGATPSPGGQPIPNSKKLVIRKNSQNTGTKSLKTTTRSPSAVTSRSTTISLGAGSKTAPIPPLTRQELQARKDKEARKRRKKTVTVSIVLVLLALVGLGALLFVKHQDEMARRANLFALTNSRTESSEMFIAVSNNTARISSYYQRAVPMEAEIQSAVEMITGSRLTIAPLPEPEPETSAAPVAAAPVEAASTNTPTESANVSGTGTTEPVAGDAPAEAAATDTATAAPAMNVENVATPPPVDEVAAAEPPAPTHPVRGSAREALMNIQTLALLDRKAADIMIESQALVDAVRISLDSKVAAVDTLALREMTNRVQEMVTEAKALLDSAGENHGKVLRIRRQIEKETADRLAAEKEVLRLKEEAERKEQERLAIIARTASEIQQTKSDRTDVRTMFDANNFEEALQALKQRSDNYQTNDGKAAFQVVLDRYDYLIKMKTGLIAAIQEAPFAWGWGFGAASRDIVNADEKGIYLKGVPKPRPWSEAQIPQMLKLVDYYLGSRTMRARIRIEIAVGAAIYCDEFGEQGRERSKLYANRALDLGLDRDVFNRLLEASWQ